jgi:hypothetical protein
MTDARLIDLRKRAAVFASAEEIAELESRRLLWWAVASRETDPNKRPPIRADELEAGYFKVNAGVHAPTVPAAIWHETSGSGNWCASRGFRPVADFDIAEARRSWVWIAKKPIPYEEYAAALEAGSFPSPVTGHPSMIGHNQPPEGIGAVKVAVDEQVTAAEKFLAEHNKTGLDENSAKLAAIKWESLNALFKSSDEQRSKETDPLYKQWQDKLAEWAFIKKAAAAAKRLRGAMDAYADKERARRAATAQAELAKGTPIANIAPVEPVRIQGATRAVPQRAAPLRTIISDAAANLAHLQTLPEFKDRFAKAQLALQQQMTEELHARGLEVPGAKRDRVAA